MNIRHTLFIAIAIIAASANAEQLRLKYAASVDVVENGKVVGTRKLKAGTVVTVVGDAANDGANANAKASAKIAPSALSPMMFKTTKGTKPESFFAELKLADTYVGTFDGKDGQYWSVDAYLYNRSWEGMTFFQAYASKSSSVGKSIEKFLADGEMHACVAKVRIAGDGILTIEAFEPTSKK